MESKSSMAIPPRRWVGYALIIAGLSLLFDAYTFLRTNWSPLHIPMFAPTELAFGHSLVVVGVALLIAPTLIRIAHTFAPGASLKMREGLARHSVELPRQRQVRKPTLRRPISGLPNFGLVAGISYALIAIVMMVMSTAFRPTPRGVWAHLLKPESVPQNSDPWTEPLVVLAKSRGPGKNPNLYVNLKLVPWVDFDHVLKQELSRRRDWVVYVGGDDEVQWQDVVYLIDVARRDHATAYLFTGSQKF
jgi:biopolymer transport protein ExbD